jgi:hypothetical protein
MRARKPAAAASRFGHIAGRSQPLHTVMNRNASLIPSGGVVIHLISARLSYRRI